MWYRFIKVHLITAKMHSIRGNVIKVNQFLIFLDNTYIFYQQSKMAAVCDIERDQHVDRFANAIAI